MQVRLFEQDHGFIHTLGLRIGGFGYSTDVGRAWTTPRSPRWRAWIPGSSAASCATGRTGPTRDLDQVLAWAARVGARRTVLTHMGTDMDWAWLRANLPAGVEPGYDGMVIRLNIIYLMRHPDSASESRTPYGRNRTPPPARRHGGATRSRSTAARGTSSRTSPPSRLTRSRKLMRSRMPSPGATWTTCRTNSAICCFRSSTTHAWLRKPAVSTSPTWRGPLLTRWFAAIRTCLAVRPCDRRRAKRNLGSSEAC